MEKPRGGNYHWIDNHIVKATRFKGKFTDLIVKTKEIEVFNHDSEQENEIGIIKKAQLNSQLRFFMSYTNPQ